MVMKKINFCRMVMASVIVAGMMMLAGCGSAEPIDGKYSTDNKGLTFSDFEFFDDGSVTYYCGGYENSHGSYEENGSNFVLTIDDYDEDSYFKDSVAEIQEYCKIIVTPKDENTIAVEIKAKNSGEIYAGQLGEEEYVKE